MKKFIYLILIISIIFMGCDIFGIGEGDIVFDNYDGYSYYCTIDGDLQGTVSAWGKLTITGVPTGTTNIGISSGTFTRVKTIDLDSDGYTWRIDYY